MGSAFIQVYTPVNQGVRMSDGLVTIAREAFEGEDINGTSIFFTDVIVRETGPEGVWYQTVVEAEFEYDEIR